MAFSGIQVKIEDTLSFESGNKVCPAQCIRTEATTRIRGRDMFLVLTSTNRKVEGCAHCEDVLHIFTPTQFQSTGTGIHPSWCT